jgi:hypothetical protein
VQAQSQPEVYRHSRHVGLRVTRALDLAASPTQWVRRSFAFFAEGGSRKCRRRVDLIRCRRQNQMAHAASRPTLAKTQGWGTLSRNGARAKIVKGGPPAGSRKCLRRVDLIRCPQQSQMAHAASRPTLAKNARVDWIRAKARIETGVVLV